MGLPDRVRPFLCWALALGTIGWAAVIVWAPYLVAHLGSHPPGPAAAASIYVVAGLVCHQHPDRSFHLWGIQMPVCARCTGLYVGAALAGAVALVSAHRVRRDARGERRLYSVRAWRVGLVLAAAPTALTVVLEKLWGVGISNATRAWTGGPLGGTVAWIVLSSLRGAATSRTQAAEVNYQHAIDGGGAGTDR